MARKEEKNKAQGLSASVASPTAGAVLPLVVGAGIGAHSIYATRSKILGDIFARTSTSSVSQASDIIRSIKDPKSRISSFDLGRKIKELNQTPWDKAVSAGTRQSHILGALEQSSRAFTDQGIRSGLHSSVKNFMSEGNRTDEDLVNFISSHKAFNNSSHISKRAGMRFIDNVRALKSSIKSNEPLIKIKEFAAPGFTDIKLKSLSKEMQAQISAFSAGISSNNKVSVSRMARQGVEGSTLRVQFSGGLIGKNVLPLYIPEAVKGTGLVVSGQQLETQNLVGHLISVDKMGRIKGMHKPEEWIMMRAKEQLIPEIKAMRGPNKSKLGKLVKAFRNKNRMETLSTFDDETRQAYQNLPRILSGADNPHQALIDDSLQRVRFVDEHGTFLDKKGLEGVIKNFPEYEKQFGLRLQATSPGSAAGGGFRVISHRDAISGIKLPSGKSPTPFDFLNPTSRRPYQRYKPYTPSVAAAELLSKDELTQAWKFAQGDMFGNKVHGPAAMTFYKGRPDRALEEGMLWIDEAHKAKYGISNLVQPMMDLKDATSLLNQMEPVPGKPGVMRGKANAFLNPGEYIGYKENGTALLASNRMKIIEATAFEDKLRLSLSEQLPIEDYSKLFGTDKVMRGFESRNNLMSRVARAGGAAGAQVDAMGHASNFKKNRALHLMQMFSATVEFNQQNMQPILRGKTPAIASAISKDLSHHRESYFNKISGIASNQGFEAATRDLVSTARKAGLRPEQQALAFGALLHSHEGQLESFGLDQPVIDLIHKSSGSAWGVAHHFSGGPKTMTGVTANKMATIEPRMFQILKSGHFGSFGSEIADDIQSRSILTNVDAVRSVDELRKSLISIHPTLDQKSIGTASRIEKLSTMSSDILDPEQSSYIFNTGGQIDFEGVGGLGKVHIPHGDHMKELTEFRTNAGQTIQSDLSHDFLDFIERAKSAKLTGEDFSDIHNKFANRLMTERSGIIAGKHGLASGSVSGSRLLTAITKNESHDIGLLRIGEHHFSGMITDMMDSAKRTMSGSALDEHLEGLAAMRNTALEGGEVGGGVFRHPFIGPHSFAPIRLKVDRSIQDNVVDIPNVYKTIKMGGESKQIAASLAMGLGSDTDADALGIMLGTPKMESRFRAMAHSGSEYMNIFEDFAYKAQALKMKAGNIADESFGAGAIKLAAADQYVGTLSTHMTRTKMALLHYGAQGDPDSIHNALQMIEFLEQGPISGKHLNNETAMSLPEMMGDMTRAFENKSTARDMPTVMDSFIKPGALESIAKDGSYEIGGRTVPIKGLDQKKAFETIDAALYHFGNEKDIGSAARNYALMKGKLWNSGVNEIGEHLNSMEGGILDAFSEHISEPRSIARGLASAAETISTHFKANKKAYLAAGAASLVVAAALSAPQGDMNAPIQHARMNNGTGDNVTPENIHPDSHVNGAPSTPGMPSGPGPIRSNNPAMTAHVKVRGRMNGGGNVAALSAGVRGALGVGTSTNTKISDDRSSLTSQKLQDILAR